TRESDAPTVIFVPDLQYPDGFYVWISDGSAYMDADRQLLYWYPSRDEPGWIHHLQIEPLLADKEALGWSYFFQGGQGVRAQGDSTLTGGGVAQ
ncbi:MAG: hypothetical protein VX938_10700, partial [Myxococcota bacterium]|nr:hypothetical protein [Myxococcota bacterium]